MRLRTVSVLLSNVILVIFTGCGGGGPAFTPGLDVPVFSPPPGVYTSAQAITLSSTTSGATIRYTLDGTMPSATVGTVYSAPVTVSVPTTIKAFTAKPGMSESPVIAVDFYIGRFAQVSALGYHTVGRMQDGAVVAWGCNSNGQLGDGSTLNRGRPIRILGSGGSTYLDEAVWISGGAYHSGAVRRDGTVLTWGVNTDGQLGHGGTYDSATPGPLLDTLGTGVLGGVAEVSLGDVYSMAAMADGTVRAWGRSQTGFRNVLPVPVQDPGGAGFLAGVAAVSAGEYAPVYLKKDGTVWATSGQVPGPGGTGFLTEVAAVAAGDDFTVALRRDGSVWSWGNNLHGQLGDGTTAYRASPVQVLGPASVGHLSGIVSLAAGSLSQHVLAVRSDGTLWAWGGNSQGCLGDGTTTDRPVPVQVLGQDGSGFLSGVVAATAGFYHSVAVRADGTAWAWGANNTLQLGANLSGFLLESHTPMKVGGP